MQLAALRLVLGQCQPGASFIMSLTARCPRIRPVLGQGILAIVSPELHCLYPQ